VGGGGWNKCRKLAAASSSFSVLLLHASEHKTGVYSFFLSLTTIFGVTGLFLSGAKSFLLLTSHGLLFLSFSPEILIVQNKEVFTVKRDVQIQ
jgi:hypothetical protein